jgi:hypothetical protein
MEYDKIYDLLRQGEILEVEKALKSVQHYDEKSLILSNLVVIFRNEVSNNMPHTVFDYSTDIDELSDHYTRTKLMLRRIEFDLPKEYIDEFYEYCEYNGVSFCMLLSMIMKNVINKEKVCLGLASLYREKKGEQSFEAQSFLSLYQYITKGCKNGG